MDGHRSDKHSLCAGSGQRQRAGGGHGQRRTGRDTACPVHGGEPVPVDGRGAADGARRNHPDALPASAPPAAPGVSQHKGGRCPRGKSERQHLCEFSRPRQCRHAHGHSGGAADEAWRHRHGRALPSDRTEHRLHPADPGECGGCPQRLGMRDPL